MSQQCIADGATHAPHLKAPAAELRGDLEHFPGGREAGHAPNLLPAQRGDYRSATRAATSSPIARQAVAAGDGALITCSAPGLSRNSKSSTNDPSRRMACARTPTGPGSRASAVTSGTRRCRERTNTDLLSERWSSNTVVRVYRAMKRHSPGNDSADAASRALNARRR